MEPDKIGKFIANLRKEKNLNQQELANELYVSTKTISKWETGRGIPDLASLRKICEYFNITLEELLNGKLNEKNTSKTFKYVENYKKKFILRLIIIIAILLVAFLSLYFINNYNKVKVYSLSGESEHFSYTDGLFIFSMDEKILVNGKLTSTTNDIKLEDIKKMSLKINDKIVKEATFVFDGIDYEKVGYNELFDFNSNSLNNISVIVEYKKGKERLTEELKINLDLVLKNNKMFYWPTKKISNEPLNTQVEDTKINDKITSLKNNGFQDKYDHLLEKQLNDYETITLRKDLSQIWYYNSKTNMYAITSGSKIIHAFTLNNYRFSYNTETQRFECLSKCPSDAYETIKDYLDLYNTIFN